MRDFPFFDTEFGIASLVLKEVPYREEAYIIIRSTQQPEELIRECVSFCRMVGAEKIYARGHEYLKRYPLHSILYEMRGQALPSAEPPDRLWPVTAETVGEWRRLLNRRMAAVDNAGTLEGSMEKEILASGGAYYVHRDGEPLGAFWLHENEIKLIASLQPGAGERVMRTLFSLVPGEPLRLEVASTNHRAIQLYKKVGFLKTGELRRWYRIFP